MKDYVIIGLLVIILMILLSRRMSSYTTAEVGMFAPSIPSRVAQLVLDDIADIIINQTKGLPVLASVNSLIAKVNAAESSAQLVPYTSETQITQMFQKAYDNGESSLSRTDKAILRFTILIGMELQRVSWGSGNLPAISFTPTGKPVWADEVLGQTGLTIQEGIVKVMELVKNFTGATDTSAITAINSVLPSNLTPFASRDDYFNKATGMTDPSYVWFIKFVSIGPLYMLWLAENKWRIDLSWRLVQDNPPTALTA